ncbi:cupin domain-containing protein [Enterococcus sp. DIV0242_7C1]|uniref:Cupin type-2 domain-containing protein n=1 Tax=Candidatus Enterococcus dunnyi TaxID=1834192 RepID=A0A200JCW1_9ENTE|nr:MULTISPECIES: cupin domain-containing protein [unclassified Enterococcus]MBO0471835.1 cupin domain-containing protein [Enterococcus sp. DIV0242_7C1]OUZ34701.1 hypothetical protein A5889_000176 [Enterococcus sp. 9D6_DIV0238]
MKYTAIDLKQKLTLFNKHWSPKVIAEMNDYQFKLVKILDRFVWHQHEDTDEVFLVLDGEMTIEFRDGKVELAQGQMFVIPKGVEHRPFSEKECQILLIEPKGVVKTGDNSSELTAENDVWI